jgi:hypothetical protein
VPALGGSIASTGLGRDRDSVPSNWRIRPGRRGGSDCAVAGRRRSPNQLTSPGASVLYLVTSRSAANASSSLKTHGTPRVPRGPCADTRHSVIGHIVALQPPDCPSRIPQDEARDRASTCINGSGREETPTPTSPAGPRRISASCRPRHYTVHEANQVGSAGRAAGQGLEDPDCFFISCP